MADVNAAIEFVLKQEDATLEGKVTHTPCDRGGATRYGLTERWHPELIACGFFDEEKMDAGDALEKAEMTYATLYGRELGIAAIENQGIADRVLSFAVNEGTHQATIILQHALVASGQNVVVDGRVGPATIAAINAAYPEVLLTNLRSAQAMFYEHLAAVRPDQQPFLAGWLNRANA